MTIATARLDALRVLIAHFDTVEEAKRMGVHDLKEALRHIPGIETLTITPMVSGHQLLSMAGRTFEVGPMATNDEIERALTAHPIDKYGIVRGNFAPSLLPPLAYTTVNAQTAKPNMAITGASYLGEQFKAKLQAAKDKISKATDDVSKAMDDLNSTADQAADTAKAIQAEADDLKAALGQGSNS